METRFHLRVFGIALSLFCACRPDGYVAPEPELPDSPQFLGEIEIPTEATDEELAHYALFGEESAPPSVLQAPDDATISASGLTSQLLRQGTGKKPPRVEDTAVIHFTGWDSKGARFDSTLDRGRPDRSRVLQLPAGMREALTNMVVGEKRRLWIPERLAFGPVPSPGRPAGDVVMDVELIEVHVALEVPEAPDDVAAAPSDAIKTSSGLRYKVLKPSNSTRTPTRDERVRVHYTGWTPDGNMFDSSIARGEPAVFGVEAVIKGWTEALLLMTVGQQIRVWIPGRLAYGDNPERSGVPAGPLVFDVELIDVLP